MLGNTIKTSNFSGNKDWLWSIRSIQKNFWVLVLEIWANTGIEILCYYSTLHDYFILSKVIRTEPSRETKF